MGSSSAVFDRLHLNWALFTFIANLLGHLLQLHNLFLPPGLPLDSVWTSNVSCYKRRETAGSSSCWPHVHITVAVRACPAQNTSSLTGNEARIWLLCKQAKRDNRCKRRAQKHTNSTAGPPSNYRNGSEQQETLGQEFVLWGWQTDSVTLFTDCL